MTDLREALRATVSEWREQSAARMEAGKPISPSAAHYLARCAERIGALLAADERRDMQVGMQVDKPESAETPRSMADDADAAAGILAELGIPTPFQSEEVAAAHALLRAIRRRAETPRVDGKERTP